MFFFKNIEERGTQLALKRGMNVCGSWMESSVRIEVPMYLYFPRPTALLVEGPRSYVAPTPFLCPALSSLHDLCRAKREAAAQLLSNHGAVARFACRALGLPGVPPVAAELADPNASSNDDFVPMVDSALRCVALALVDGTQAVRLPENAPVEQVNAALAYLRDRVGVPRDMSFEAARQFRAHLNWMGDQLKQA